MWVVDHPANTYHTHHTTGTIVSGGMDSRLWVWPSGGVRGSELFGHGAPVSQVGWGVTTRDIACKRIELIVNFFAATNSNGVVCKAVLSAKHITIMETCARHVVQVVYNPAAAGACVITASYDKTLRVWDVGGGGGGREVGIMAGAHKAPVLELAVAPDGMCLSGG
jgi:hypothetical protein